MFGIPLRFIVGGIITLVILGALYGAKRSYDNEIRASERAKYSALITKCAESKRTPEQCAEEWTKAVAYNVTLQNDLDKLRTASRSCSAETQKGGELKAKADAEKDRRLARTEGYREGLRQSNAQLEAKLAAASTGSKTCEQTMTSVGAALRGVALQRIRFALGFDDAPADADAVKIK